MLTEKPLMFPILLTLALGCTSGKVEVPLDDTSPDSGDPDSGDSDSGELPCTPGPEICDGLDNDCDGLYDDADPDRTGASTWCADRDGDGYGDAGSVYVACAQPVAFVADYTDCDDAEFSVNPGADEVCNDIDDDCDALLDGDDDSLTGAPTWYLDRDGDGYGYASSAQDSCSAPSGTVSDDTDCDDTDPGINPDADEICDDADNDCDSTVDAEDDSLVDAPVWYTDGDGDGYGGEPTTDVACEAPSGTVAGGTDCSDTEFTIHPGAAEVCDGVDNECDGLVDDEDDSLSGAPVWYLDYDGDGYGYAPSARQACDQPAGTVADSTDCDDAISTVNPGASEVCDDIDDDCDGLVDGRDDSLSDASTWYTDLDGDGYGDASSSQIACHSPSGAVADSTDCDDTRASVNTSGTEACNDSLDNDCDGEDAVCEDCANGIDDDGDGRVDCADSDCTEGWGCVPTGSDYTTTLGNEMIVIVAGMFSMGSGSGDPAADYLDHEVTLTQDFYLGQTEVTQSEWAGWTGAPDTSPSYFSGCPECPVEQVSWQDAAMYANRLSSMEGLANCYLADGADLAAAYVADPYSCPGYRLPTEAEWEYAARAGEDTTYSGSDMINDVAWFASNSGSVSHDACSLAANAWGLCDMSGNVWEWNTDWYSSSYSGYGDGADESDPPGPGSGSWRVVRGGNWSRDAATARVANRGNTPPGSQSNVIGFRLARTVH